MIDFLSDLLSPVTMIFALSSMLSVGLGYTLREVLGPLRDVKAVALVLIANFVLVPLWALLLSRVLSLDEPYEVGLLIAASAAGAPFFIKLVQAADGDLGFAATMLVLLLPVTVIYMPIVLPLLIPDASDISALAIATPLFLSMLLPLIIGFAVRAWNADLAARIRPYLGPISNVALILLLVLTVITSWDAITGVFGERLILAALLFIIGSFVIGFTLGATDDLKDEIGLGTAQRNIAAATVVATTSLDNPDTLVAVVVTSTVSMVILLPLAGQLRKYFGQSAKAERSADTSGAA
jgi:BASS family bile acid:Na+ symporter